MYTLDDLLKSLVTVCVRYRVEKLKLNSEVKETVTSLLDLSNSELIEHLEAIINDATNSERKRRTLMNYFISQIELLSNFLEQKNTCEQTDLILKQDQIIQFFCDLQKLLETSHSTEITFIIKGNEVKIYGLMPTSGLMPFMPRHSKAGTAILEDLFKPFQLELSTSTEKLRQFIIELFQTQQQKLQLVNLQHDNANLVIQQKAFIAKIEELAALNEVLITQVEKLTTQGNDLASKNAVLSIRVEEIGAEHNTLTAKIEDLTTQCKDLTSKNAVLSTKVEEVGAENSALTTKIEDLSTELKAQQQTLERTNTQLEYYKEKKTLGLAHYMRQNGIYAPREASMHPRGVYNLFFPQVIPKEQASDKQELKSTGNNTGNNKTKSF